MITAAAIALPLTVLWVLRESVPAAGNTLLGLGGIGIGFGAATGRHAFRGLGCVPFGMGVALLGLNALGGETTNEILTVWAIGLVAFGLGVVVFGVGVILSNDLVRNLSNIVFGAGVAAMGIGVAALADGSTAQTVIGVGVAGFGLGIVAAAAGLLVGADREPGAAVAFAGLGGVLAGLGGILVGLDRFDTGAHLIGTGLLIAGVGVATLGIGGIVFGVGGVIDRPALRRAGNFVFAAGGFAFGAGTIAAGIGRVLGELDGTPDGETLVTMAILAAGVGAVALGSGVIGVARRDLHRPSDTFQLRPDTFRRRGISVQGPPT